MPTDKDFIPFATDRLMDEEVRTEAERRAKISEATLKIEEILIQSDFTMGDLAEILDLFNSRAHSIFSKTKIKEVKETYERFNQ